MNPITLTQLQQFRAALYHTFMHRADAVFQLMDALAGDAQARRGYARLFARMGTLARPPQPRGKSPGRPKGYRLPLRPDCPMVKKGKRSPRSRPES